MRKIKLLFVMCAVALCTAVNAQFTVQGVPYQLKDNQALRSQAMTLKSATGNFSFDDIEFWVGEGDNEAVLAVQWNVEGETSSLVWGYRWADGEEPTGETMVRAIAKADKRFFIMTETGTQYGSTIAGLGYDTNGDGQFSLTKGDEILTPDENGVIYVSQYDYDGWTPTDSEDWWQSGWYTDGFWGYWVKDTQEDNWNFSGVGATGRKLTNGCWDGWNFKVKFEDKEWKEHEGAPAPVEEPFVLEAEVGGIYFVNEDWFGHDHSSVNYLTPDHTMHYRVYRGANPLADGGSEVLGVTTQYGCIHEGRFYLVSKQAKSNGEAEGVGGRLIVADAKTMKKIASFENIGGGDGRAFLGVTPEKGYISTSNGIFLFDITSMEVGSKISGTEGSDDLYSKQVGIMVKSGDYVFAVGQSAGVYVIDPSTDKIIKTLEFPTVYSLAVDMEGMVWATLTGEGSALLRIDPATWRTEQFPLPEGLTLNSGWGSWRAGTFCAGVTSNVLYFMIGGWGDSEGNTIVKYDISANTFEEDFFTLPDQDKTNKQVFYGSGFRVDPYTDRLVCMATQSGWGTNYSYNWVHFVDSETGELLETIKLDDYYWFPAMPVFYEESGDSPVTGMADNQLSVSIYPNPFTDYLMVNTDSAKEVVLYDLSGKAVLNVKLQSGSNRIDTAKLPQGTYLLKSGADVVKVVK